MTTYLHELINRARYLNSEVKKDKDANPDELYLIREILKQYGLTEESVETISDKSKPDLAAELYSIVEKHRGSVELHNELIGWIRESFIPKHRWMIENSTEEAILQLGKIQLNLMNVLKPEDHNNVADFIHQAREYLANIK